MDKSKIKEQKVIELEVLLNDKIREYQEKYLKMRMGQEKDVHVARKIRKEIAWLKTIIKEKQLDNLTDGKDE